MYGVIVLGKEKRVKGPLYPPFYGGKGGLCTRVKYLYLYDVVIRSIKRFLW